MCPNSSDSFNFNGKKEKHYIQGDPYVMSVFETKGCRLLDIRDSLHLLKKRYKESIDNIQSEPNLNTGTKPLHIHFVGDSLGKQFAVALRCELEERRINSYSSAIHTNPINISFELDVNLRLGVHCHPKCISEPAFRLDQSIMLQKTSGLHACSECNKTVDHFNLSSEGNPTVFLPVNKSNKFHWSNRIPTTANILIFETGAWYNRGIGLENSNDDYLQTIHEFIEHIQPFILKGVSVVWIALPVNKMFFNDYNYEWCYFEGRNEATRKAFIAANLDILFVDFNPATSKRLAVDQNVSFDGLHWRSPGPTSVPSFIMQVVLHSLAVRSYSV
mmetsp:Transcript_29710/g.42410  ORF Transcript_29710/g.42410 Transcript_29710/m.42410 type:complete len:331 (-) Transcript_29710:69-1061(-)